MKKMLFFVIGVVALLSISLIFYTRNKNADIPIPNTLASEDGVQAYIDQQTELAKSFSEVTIDNHQTIALAIQKATEKQDYTLANQLLNKYASVTNEVLVYQKFELSMSVYAASQNIEKYTQAHSEFKTWLAKSNNTLYSQVLQNFETIYPADPFSEVNIEANDDRR